jgi:hypothetical protein
VACLRIRAQASKVSKPSEQDIDRVFLSCSADEAEFSAWLFLIRRIDPASDQMNPTAVVRSVRSDGRPYVRQWLKR